MEGKENNALLPFNETGFPNRRKEKEFVNLHCISRTLNFQWKKKKGLKDIFVTFQ